jgi:hypothetical protein
MNAQNQGIASVMGGSPNLGGAPQTPVMAQGAQPPQQPPQGGLSQDLLKALAAAKVKKMQEAAKRELELQMAQQQAASGADKKTVVQQLQEGVEGAEMQEMLQKLSGGIKQAGQMSAQPQPMSGGIAAAPGANQAAQPEAMASGGIVAFKKGGTEGEEKEEPYIDPETGEVSSTRKARWGLEDVARILAAPFQMGYRDPRERSAAEKPAAINQERPLPPVAGLTAADYEDMRGGIPNVLKKPPGQRPAAVNQAIPPSAPQQPSYAPPQDGGLGSLLQKNLISSINADPAEAKKAALEEYQRMVPQDKELMEQRKKDAMALRAALERQNAPLDWSDRLHAMAQGAMGGVRGGSNWMSEGVAGGAGIRGLEAAHAAKQAQNLGILKGMSEDDYNRDIALKEKLYGVGSKAYQDAVKAREEYLKTGAHLFGTQEQARMEGEKIRSTERTHELDRRAAEQRVRLEAQLRAAMPPAEIQLIERYMKDTGASFADAYKEIAGIKRPDKFDSKAYEQLSMQYIMAKDPAEKKRIKDQMDALMGVPVIRAGGTSQGSTVDFSKLPK